MHTVRNKVLTLITLLALLGAFAITSSAAPQRRSSRKQSPSADLAADKHSDAPSHGSADSQTSGKMERLASGKIDLNTAGEKELEELPGIGPAYAKKIVAGRPYSSVSDLSKAGVPESTIKKIRRRVTVDTNTSDRNSGSAGSGPVSDGSAPSSRPNRSRSSRQDRESSSPESNSPTAQSSPSGSDRTDRTDRPDRADRNDASSSRTKSASERSRDNANSSSSSERSASPGMPGPGMVWVNLPTGVYHREGSRWYGKTKSGKYMSESDAVKAGYHAAKNERNPQ